MTIQITATKVLFISKVRVSLPCPSNGWTISTLLYMVKHVNGTHTIATKRRKWFLCCSQIVWVGDNKVAITVVRLCILFFARERERVKGLTMLTFYYATQVEKYRTTQCLISLCLYWAGIRVCQSKRLLAHYGFGSVPSKIFYHFHNLLCCEHLLPTISSSSFAATPLPSFPPFVIHVPHSFPFPQVSWIRKRDLHILTAGFLTYTSDERFQVRGKYICTISIHSHKYWLCRRQEWG